VQSRDANPSTSRCFPMRHGFFLAHCACCIRIETGGRSGGYSPRHANHEHTGANPCRTREHPFCPSLSGRRFC
jgi:hypothetical protein